MILFASVLSALSLLFVSCAIPEPVPDKACVSCGVETMSIPAAPVAMLKKHVRPAKSMVYIQMYPRYQMCKDATHEECVPLSLKQYGGVGSGVVVHHLGGEGSLILTAGHLCDRTRNMPSEMVSAIHPEMVAEVSDFEGNTYSGVALAYEYDSRLAPGVDLCLIRTNTPVEAPAVSIAEDAPEYGDALHTYGAPKGIYGPGAVLHFTGEYNGLLQVQGGPYYMLRIGGAGGSSGSMVVNMEGEIVSIISLGLRNFPLVMFGVTLPNINSFLAFHGGPWR